MGWHVVVLLLPAALLNYTDRLLITSMRDAIEGSLPMTEAQFGLLTSVFLWVYGVISPVAGFLADRYGRRWFILGSLLAWSAFTWATGHARSYEAMFLARAGMGISEAFYLPTALALICDYHREGTRSLAIGIHQCGIYVGTALGGIGGYLAEYCGWRAGFGVLGAVGAVYAIVLMRFLPGAPPSEAFPESGTASQPTPPRIRLVPALASLAGQWGYWILLTGFLLLGITTWLIYGWLPTYLREHFHLWIGAAGLSATGYVQAASVVGVLAGGRWADRWAASNPRGRMHVAALGCMIAAPGMFLMAATDAFPVGIGALLLLGLGIGFYTTNTMPILRQVTDARYSATGYGIYNFAGCIAGGLMAYAGGAFRDHHGDLALIFKGTAVGVLAAGLLLLAARPLAARTNPCGTGPAS